MEKVEYHNPQAVKAGKLPFPIPDEYNVASEGRTLFGLTFHFGNTKPKDRDRNCVTVLHDLQSGEQTDNWTSNEEMIKELSQGVTLHGFSEAVRLLFTAENFTVTFLREIEEVDLFYLPMFSAEYSHWTHVMNLSIQHGPFWFYRMQPFYNKPAPGAQLARWSKADSPPPVPF